MIVDQTIIETLEYNIKLHGFEVVFLQQWFAGLSKLDEANPELFILDWMLPRRCGSRYLQADSSEIVSRYRFSCLPGAPVPMTLRRA